MEYIKREQTVSRSPGDDNQKPMIKITNRFLLKAGFKIGSKFTIQYTSGAITIILKQH